MTPAATRELVEWATAGAALEDGQSGDLGLVAHRGDTALVAVIDALGHGAAAAEVARAAGDAILAFADLPLDELVQRCHLELQRSRGAVLSLARLDAAGTLSWVGVGNVEALLVRGEDGAAHARAALISRSGVVGYQLPQLRVTTVPVFRGDVLILTTDGISSSFSVPSPARSPTDIAEIIFRSAARGTDDALVLVARYRG